MDDLERVITLLQAQVANGAIADSIRDEIAEFRRELMSNRQLTTLVASNSDRYVSRSVAVATSDILASGGDLSTIGGVIGQAFGVGLVSGLTIGLVAGRS